MKLSPLLAQYLVVNRQLSLAGIGHFMAEPMAGNEETSGLKIQFQHNKSEKMDEGLVSFVARETGKMKSLAEADLSSYIDQVKEFLNIGKPFFLEGIGTLTPLKGEIVEFSAGVLQIEKSKEFPPSEKEAQTQGVTGEDHSLDYSDILGTRKVARFTRNRIITALLVVAGLGLTIWGGYALFRAMTREKEVSTEEVVTQPVMQDMIQTQNNTAVPVNTPAVTPPESTGYKFIIKEASLKSAYTRYTYLKEECKVDVHISTADSVKYQVFFRLPVNASDTARIADSLNVLYISKGQPKVRVVKY